MYLSAHQIKGSVLIDLPIVNCKCVKLKNACEWFKITLHGNLKQNSQLYVLTVFKTIEQLPLLMAELIQCYHY